MRRLGLAANIQELAGGWNQEDGAAAARLLIQQGALPTAVLAYNDDVAAGALKTFESAGISVPGDVSIIGWNDSYLAGLSNLNLTSVSQDVDQLARLAVKRWSPESGKRRQRPQAGTSHRVDRPQLHRTCAGYDSITCPRITSRRVTADAVSDRSCRQA